MCASWLLIASFGTTSTPSSRLFLSCEVMRSRYGLAFRFDVAGQHDSDAVLVRLAGRPVFTPRAFTVVGSVADTASVAITLPEPVDPARSRLEFGIGTTPLAVLAGSYRWLRVYPFD